MVSNRSHGPELSLELSEKSLQISVKSLTFDMIKFAFSAVSDKKKKASQGSGN